MTRKEETILTNYLCMALSYNLRCHVPTAACTMTLTGKRLNYFCFHKDECGYDYSDELEVVLDPLNDLNNRFIVKPLLRPMESMTKEEVKEFNKFCVIDEEAWNGEGISGFKNQAEIMHKGIVWLLENHFDFMGLIEKGLAIDKTKKQ